MLQTPAAGPREVHAALARMRADAALVNGAIADGVLIDTADEALPELTAGLLAAADAATAAATAALGRTHDCGVLRGRGFVSTKAWLKATTRCGDRDAARLLARSRDLQRPEFAPTRTAWLAGRIVGAGVREISLGLVACEKKTRTDPDLTALVFGECQQVLLDIAQRENADHVRAAAARILATVFPDGATADEQEAYHAQHLRLTRVGNETDVRGMLSAESEALLSTALDRIVDRWYREGVLGPQPVLDPVTGEIDQEATDAAIEAAKNGGTGGVQRAKPSTCGRWRWWSWPASSSTRARPAPATGYARTSS